MLKLPERDEAAAHIRKSIAARRVGSRRCVCGESRPDALIAGSNPVICAACKRERDGKTPFDNHHPAGRANNPTTIAVPVNDHRAELNVAQYKWPRKTLENPHRSKELAAAAAIRGFADTNLYLMKELLIPVAEMLEKRDADRPAGPKKRKAAKTTSEKENRKHVKS